MLTLLGSILVSLSSGTNYVRKISMMCIRVCGVESGPAATRYTLVSNTWIDKIFGMMPYHSIRSTIRGASIALPHPVECYWSCREWCANRPNQLDQTLNLIQWAYTSAAQPGVE
jgi:hypothetical protein